jgi:hypothetical protein
MARSGKRILWALRPHVGGFRLVSDQGENVSVRAAHTCYELAPGRIGGGSTADLTHKLTHQEIQEQELIHGLDHRYSDPGAMSLSQLARISEG